MLQELNEIEGIQNNFSEALCFSQLPENVTVEAKEEERKTMCCIFFPKSIKVKETK